MGLARSENTHASSPLDDKLEKHCSLADFDFDFLHDYAPLMPYDTGSGYEFHDTGVYKSLAYIDLIDTVGDLKSLVGGAMPVYVTEYGTLMNNSGRNWVSRWYDKGVSLLALHHWLELASEGADGLWFWDAVSKWFRVVDITVSPPATNALYDLLARAFALDGRIARGTVSGSSLSFASGDIGTGCWDNDSSVCWYVAYPAGLPALSVRNVRSYAVYDAITKMVTVALLNFATASAKIDVRLDGFGVSSLSLTFQRWSLSSGSSWNNNLGAPAVSNITKSPTVSGGVATLADILVPRRGVAILEIPVP